jgi:hypothetical protein
VCRKGIGALMGEELASNQWVRLTPQMHDWVARIVFLLPCTPWGYKGSGLRKLEQSVEQRRKDEEAKKDGPRYSGWADDDEEDGGAAAGGADDEQAQATMLLLCLMELLAKGRLLFHLFDDDAEAAMANRTHSCLPVQPDQPDACPYAKKPHHDPKVASSHSAVLLMLAPVQPQYLKKLYPQCLLLNDGGVGGELREKLGHRIAFRMLLSGVGESTSAVAPWVAIPSVYSADLALAALAKLGGPPLLMLRHPHAVKFTAAGGGEISLEADDLDAVLFCLLDPENAAKATGKAGSKISTRVAKMVAASSFWPDGEGPNGHGSAVLLLEELLPSQPLPQDGRKGWFDVTHRAYCLRTTAEAEREEEAPPEPPKKKAIDVSDGAKRGDDSDSDSDDDAKGGRKGGGKGGGDDDDDDDDDDDAPQLEAADGTVVAASGGERAAGGGGSGGGGGGAKMVTVPAIKGGIAVLSGCCRFPSQNLNCSASSPAGVDGQHSPQLPHTAVPLGPEMARGAFEHRLPLASLFESLHAMPLKELITHCLSSPQHPLLHLCGLSILGGATAGARKQLEDPLAVHFAHFEYFGRPFAVAAELHAEHKPLIDDLLEPQYAQRYGQQMATLVQKSFLRDVVQPDLACVACNELRAPDSWVTRHLKRLFQFSPHEDVRSLANAIHQHYYSVAKTGRLNEQGEKVASEKHMQMLYDDLLHGLPEEMRYG